MRRAMRKMYLARTVGASPLHAGNAFSAAFTAASTSASLPCATSLSLLSVAGLIVAKYAGPAALSALGSTNAPLMKCP